ncbi:hypothetical protein SAMN05216360_104311 [Methylobacterium phyllostachyos]|uniref:(2Fe-2S) ferredoxin n=1 Tax=Methylobacterium phyllostachyos TaxID=582672 RepID=A0A1G9XB82_9HYPH|nr:hypothetical protein [Methylobacterium phyllostachyos]SDM93593.1 hypothetical protein SAMN05216360_104311 [Methylobacterium phyllostachyos]
MTESRSPGDSDRRPAGRLAKTKLTEIVVVCAKCAKRQGLRPAAVRALLKKAGKQATRDASGSRRKLRIVESGCLGPCPKRAIAVATGASLAAGRVILLDPEATPAEALATVLHPIPPRRPSPEFGPNTALAAVAHDESPPAR